MAVGPKHMAIGGAVAQLKSISIVELPGVLAGIIAPHGGGMMRALQYQSPTAIPDSRGLRALKGIFSGAMLPSNEGAGHRVRGEPR